MLDGIDLGPLHGDVAELREGIGPEGRRRDNRGGVDVVQLALGHGQADTIVGEWLDVRVAVENSRLGRQDAGESKIGRGVLKASLVSYSLQPDQLLKPGLDI